MATRSCTLIWTWADSGGVGYTFLHTGVKFQHHWLLPTSKPSNPRPQSGPHHGPPLRAQLWNLPRPNALVARAGITVAQDAVPTHQLQSALTLLQPRSLPVPRSQPQMNRTSLPGVTALASMAILPPHLLSQLDANGKKSTQKTPTHSTPHFLSAPVGLTASTVQWDPTAMLLSSTCRCHKQVAMCSSHNIETVITKSVLCARIR